MSRKRFCRILLVNQADIIKTVNKAMNVAFIIDGSDSITGRPNGGQWKQVKQWVWNVISALDLESRPAVSYVSVMQVRDLSFNSKIVKRHHIKFSMHIEQSYWVKNGGQLDAIH